MCTYKYISVVYIWEIFVLKSCGSCFSQLNFILFFLSKFFFGYLLDESWPFQGRKFRPPPAYSSPILLLFSKPKKKIISSPSSFSLIFTLTTIASFFSLSVFSNSHQHSHSFLFGCNRTCINSSLCDYRRPIPSSPHYSCLRLHREPASPSFCRLDHFSPPSLGFNPSLQLTASSPPYLPASSQPIEATVFTF